MENLLFLFGEQESRYSYSEFPSGGKLLLMHIMQNFSSVLKRG